MTLTTCQQIILWALFIAPEDPSGFEKLKRNAACAKWRSSHPGEAKEAVRRHARANREKNRQRAVEWRKHNPITEKQKKQTREWHAKNRPYMREYMRRYVKDRRNSDPDFKLRGILSKRVYNALRGRSKSSLKTLNLLGCSVPELRAHLEKQFRPGMTWENHGPIWHVDHRKPCASFDLTDMVQQKECFHFSNLQPLFVEENLSKGAKLNNSCT